MKNAGFVAYGIHGSYDVLAIVDQTHLPGTVKDRITGSILGAVHDVKMMSTVAGKAQEFIVAMLYVDLEFICIELGDQNSLICLCF